MSCKPNLIPTHSAVENLNEQSIGDPTFAVEKTSSMWPGNVMRGVMAAGYLWHGVSILEPQAPKMGPVESKIHCFFFTDSHFRKMAMGWL
jgi:hypothetical protein